MILKEKMCINYDGFKGQIVFVCDQYATFNPFNSKALILIFKENWEDVTLL